MLEHLGPAYNEYEVRRTMDRLFDKPGTLMYLQTFRCAKCAWNLDVPADIPMREVPVHDGLRRLQVTGGAPRPRQGQQRLVTLGLAREEDLWQTPQSPVSVSPRL